MQEQEYNMNKNAMDLNFIAGTPMMGNTPAYGYGGASEYSTMGTPKYDAAFSPGPN